MIRTPLENWIADKAGITGRPDPARLLEYQLYMLRHTLHHAKANSRFYKERLSGIEPDSIVSLHDLTRLPLTSAADLTANPNDFLCVSPRDIGRIVTLSTSGTTGNPKRLFFTEADQELTVDFFHHGMTTLADTDDRVMIFMPGAIEGSVGDLLKKALSRFGCGGIVYGPIRDNADALDALIREKATCIVGIPAQIVTLARTSLEKRTPLKLKSVLLSADYVPLAATPVIERAWNAAVYSHYGMTETGLGGGVECACRDGYHLREADLLVEIIDPVTGLPVPDGAEGEVVFSTLTRRGMPLIRYRTGDRARFLTAPCPCGTVLRRLGRVSGRFSEAISLQCGNTLSITELDELILSCAHTAAYSAQLTTAADGDRLSICVQPSGPAFDRGQLENKLLTALGQRLEKARLTLELQVGTVDFFTNGTSKRKITDNRQTPNQNIRNE